DNNATRLVAANLGSIGGYGGMVSTFDALGQRTPGTPFRLPGRPDGGLLLQLHNFVRINADDQESNVGSHIYGVVRRIGRNNDHIPRSDLATRSALGGALRGGSGDFRWCAI